MAAYSRQSSFADGSTINASLFNNEYDALAAAFVNTSGHKHDGTTGEGPVIALIGDANLATPLNKVLIDSSNDHIEFYVDVSSSAVQQLYIADGVVAPVTDSDIDLGTSSLYYKNAYIDAITTTGNVAVGGNLTVTGTTTFNGGTLTLGDADTDNIVFGGEVDSNIIPDDDNTYDLGSSSKEWKDIYIDGVAYIDAINFNGTAITSTAAELNIMDGVTSTAAELNILDGVTSTAAELNILDGVTSTAAELNILDGVTSTAAELNILDGVTATTTELNLIDGVTATTAELNILDGVTASATDINLIDGITNGTVIASKAIITDSNKDITGGRNITISGELDAGSLDIEGDADINGTLEADAITVDGVALNEFIADTVGAMVSSNTESNITVSYDDADNTLDFVVGNISGTSALATEATITANNSTNETVFPTFVDGATGSQGLESDTGLTYNPSTGLLTSTGFAGALTGNASTATTLATARTIHGVSFDGSANIDLSETISDTIGAMVGSNTETNITVTYQDSDNTLDFVIGTLNQDTTGNAATATTLETARTIGGTSFDGSANIAVGLAATATTLATARTIHGVSFDGSANIDLSESIADTVGAMVSSNTETGLAVTYDDADNTLDFVIGAGTIASSMIAADAITGAKIADNAIDSEHYTDGSIDTAHIADAQVTTAKIAGDAITGAKIADNAINSEHYTDGSIDTAHIADSQVTTAKIADDNITQAKVANDAIGADELASNAVVNASVAAGAAIAFSKMANLTGQRALVSDSNGDVSVASVTDTELGYVSGVTSAIQTQINNKPSNGFAVAMAIAL